MSFRTKLLCLVAVPVIGLTAIAGLAASQGLSANGIAMIAVGTALFSVFVGLLLARRVALPLQELTIAANTLATEQLPALVEGIAMPSEEDYRYLAATIQPISIRREDEVGQLAAAFNAIQTVAVDAAAEQAALVRKGIADLFVNLARRNQTLIDRQIEMFDDLENSEDDPDRLAQLYKLDHLATRMRRNAESLLVLAGVEPARRRTKPVQLLDVARAALGEIEDYPRVDIAAFDEVHVPGTVAVELGHLLAELLENAAQLSPPESRVTVEGHMGKSGYSLSITDSGVGMTDAQLISANATLSTPPPVGIALGRTLGLIVVGRLATRHGITVRLQSGETEGVVAVVRLPTRLTIVPIEDEPSAGEITTDTAGAAPAASGPNGSEPAVAGHLDEADFDELVRRAWSDQPEQDLRSVGRTDEPTGLPQRRPQHPVPEEPAPAQLADALPQGSAFEHGLRRLALGDEVLGPPTFVEPEVPPAEPVFQQSPNPLAQRVPKAPESAPAPTHGGQAIGATNRTPDEVRSMLARYRRGMQHGQAGAVPPGEDDEL